MANPRFARLEELFHQALELDRAERDALVAATRREDAELGEELASLLAADADQPSAALGGVVMAAQVALATEPPAKFATPLPGEPTEPAPNPLAPPERIGPYRVIGELGRGGLGTVFLAERDDRQFSRRVALKVVRQGMESHEIAERFRLERQILAQLDHPQIARLYDGGTTRDGLPYFAMEVIDGERLDSWCRSRQPLLRTRLELLAKVCDAVAYAHRNLVLHRDLKPSNILVNRAGEPKLLDFGIAKILEAEPGVPSESGLVDGPTLTQTGQMLLTPEYASPEQILGLPLSTASDVYSLGVLLYLLVTGRPPYALDRRRLAEIERVVVQVEPEKPSTVARLFPADAPTDWSPPPGGDDLDLIVGMAMHKEASRRYGSASELAEDLRRYLSFEPVRARPDSATYRVRKFVRRHRGRVLLASFVLGTLLVAIVVTTWQARVARAERRQAERVAAFLLEVFEVSDPFQTLGRTVTAREILDRSSERIRHQEEIDPELRATLVGTMGRVYQKLSLFPSAATLLTESVDLRRQAGPKQALAASLIDLAQLELAQGRGSQARDHLEEARRLLVKIWPRSETLERRVIYLLGEATLIENEFALAEDYFDQALALANSEALGAERGEILDAIGDLWLRRQDPKRAVDFLRQALDLRIRHLGNTHPRTIETLADLALVEHERGNYAEAEKLYRDVLEANRKVFGQRHAKSAVDMLNLGLCLIFQGRNAEALPLLQSAVSLREELYGPDHPATAEALVMLARGRQQQGNRSGDPAQRLFHLREALGLARRALAIDLPKHEPTNTALLRDRFLVAELALDAQDPAAVQHYSDLVMVLRSAPALQAELAVTLAGLGRAHSQRGKCGASEAPLREAIDLFTSLGKNDEDWPLAQTKGLLGICLVELGRPDEARPLISTSQKTLTRVFPKHALTKRLQTLEAQLSQSNGQGGSHGGQD